MDFVRVPHPPLLVAICASAFHPPTHMLTCTKYTDPHTRQAHTSAQNYTPASGVSVLKSRSTGTSPRSRTWLVCSSHGSLNSRRSCVDPAHLSVSSSTCALRGAARRASETTHVKPQTRPWVAVQSCCTCVSLASAVALGHGPPHRRPGARPLLTRLSQPPRSWPQSGRAPASARGPASQSARAAA